MTNTSGGVAALNHRLKATTPIGVTELGHTNKQPQSNSIQLNPTQSNSIQLNFSNGANNASRILHLRTVGRQQISLA
jgi:hypothetical protein